ncbi:MAG: MoaD/ThiS family protein [bacterium]|nr:MoaD/ThiS family protein [bacterium]
MKIKIEFFAICKDIANTESIDMDIPEHTDTDSLLDLVINQYPALEKIAKKSAIAVNNSYRKGSISLKNGDVVSIIPPVSGG